MRACCKFFKFVVYVNLTIVIKYGFPYTSGVMVLIIKSWAYTVIIIAIM